MAKSDDIAHILSSDASPDDGEETDFDQAGDPTEIEQDEPYIAHLNDQASLYGRIITVPASAALSNPSPGVSIPVEARERVWTISFQVITIAPGEVQSSLTAQVRYGQGEARFTKTIQLPLTNLVRFSVTARYVEVSFYFQGGGPSGPGVVSASVVPGAYTGPDAYAWSWSQNPGLGTLDFYRLFVGPGVLGQIHCILTGQGAPGVPVWPLLFDSNQNVRPNAAPIIPGGRLDALFNVGDGRSYEDEIAPGTVAWQFGLVVALSTNPNTYTQVAANTFFTVDVKGGT